VQGEIGFAVAGELASNLAGVARIAADRAGELPGNRSPEIAGFLVRKQAVPAQREQTRHRQHAYGKEDERGPPKESGLSFRARAWHECLYAPRLGAHQAAVVMVL
jgi:hypothetical protein